MAHALNLTLKLKQDAETKKKLGEFAKSFATKVQPLIDAALRKSKIVHFARVVVIGDGEYLQVLTEYDGDKFGYTEFFRQELPQIFGAVFSMAEGAPADINALINDKDAFFEFAKKTDVKCVGEGKENNSDGSTKDDGYLFSAYDFRTVKDNLAKINA